MTDLVYSFRIGRFARETTYRLEADALHWTDGRREGRVAYDSIPRMQSYKVRYWGSSATYWRCVLHPASGPSIVVQAAHYKGFRSVEDRTELYLPFVQQLGERIAAANPDASFESGRHWSAALDTAGNWLIIWFVSVLRLLDYDRMARLSGWVMRRVGPRLRGHRIAQENLRAAYPEKSDAEIETVLSGMWDNFGRIFIEYSHLHKIWDYDPDAAEPGRMEFDPTSRACFLELREAKEPVLIFGGHLANWELLLWGLGQRRGEAAVVYRPVKTAPIERELAKIRRRSSSGLIAADSRALFNIKAALKRGAAVGILVDEHFPRGVDVTFFGRTCKVNPVPALFARHSDYPLYGARIIRLPNGRFRFDILPPISPPRDQAGKIDIEQTMQMLTSIIEGWVREHPEQWNWMQRRWR